MNDSLYNKLLETAWRGKLAPAEEADLRGCLASQPERQSAWELEVALTEALGELPDVPVPTNFTAGVLQAVERETAAGRPGRAARPKWSWRSLLPKAAFVAVVLGAGLFAYHAHEVHQRMELAQSVVAVSDVASLPSPEILQDFEAIRQLPPSPPPDDQLLALLK